VITAEIAALGLGLGLILALGAYLLTNLSPGGMITPGWLALLLLVSPARILLVAASIGLTYAIARLLRRWLGLHGKRFFAAVVTAAVATQMALLGCLVAVGVSVPLVGRLTEVTTLGFIVPGLIAYQMLRQPIIPTVLVTGCVTGVTYIIMLAGVLLRQLPTRHDPLVQTSLAEANPVSASSSELVGAAVVVGILLTLLLWRWGRVAETTYVDDGFAGF
jgi:gamma-polyglutamate biosynthesis protein CapC